MASFAFRIIESSPSVRIGRDKLRALKNSSTQIQRRIPSDACQAAEVLIEPSEWGEGHGPSASIGTDDLAAAARREASPGHQVDRVLDEPNVAIAKESVHSARVIAASRLERGVVGRAFLPAVERFRVGRQVVVVERGTIVAVPPAVSLVEPPSGGIRTAVIREGSRADGSGTSQVLR